MAKSRRQKFTTMYPSKKGQKEVKIQQGPLHRQLGIQTGKKIPASKMAAARAGKFGPLAKKRAMFATGMLAKGRRTAAKNRG